MPPCSFIPQNPRILTLRTPKDTVPKTNYSWLKSKRKKDENLFLLHPLRPQDINTMHYYT
jgi:hypothetical protein